MRVQFAESGHNRGIRHSLLVYRIHIILLNLLKNKVQLAPTVVVPVKLLRRSRKPDAYKAGHHPDENTE